MPTRIRPFRDGDFPAVSALLRAAFGRNAEAGLVADLRTAGQNAFELVAERDGAVAGHILFSPVRVERGDDGRMLGLAPLAIAPALQGQGIGSALMHAALETLATGPYRAIVVLGDPAYYERFGFGPAAACGLHDTFDAGDDFMALALKPGGLAGYAGRVDYTSEFNAAPAP